MDTYLDEINDPPDPDHACAGLAGRDRINSIESLALSPVASAGVYPVSMNSVLTVSAGVSGTVAGGYDVSQKPCIKHAALAVIFHDGDDAAVQIVAADMVTSDGADFTVPLHFQKFIGTDDLTFVALFYDEDGLPRFAETARAKIQPSPISGDWNRDGVKNNQGLVDYTAHFGAQNKRADVNKDQNVDYNDLSAFLSTYTD